MPPWFTKNLKRLLFLKKKAYAKFKSSFSVSNNKKFLHTKFKFESKKCYREYNEYTETPT